MVMALKIISPPAVDNNTNPNFPYLVMNQTNDAKHASGSGNICDGIHVTINIKTIAPQQIATSYFPLD
jgi:hypothetical protein